jgi:hypothetical protein
MYTTTQERAPQLTGDGLDMGTPSPGMLEVNVKDASEVDEALHKAVSQVSDAAVRHRTGVLVTRVGPGSYIVRAHPAVPYGLTRQQYE